MGNILGLLDKRVKSIDIMNICEVCVRQVRYKSSPAEQIDHKQFEIDSAQNLCVRGTLQPLVEDLAQL